MAASQLLCMDDEHVNEKVPESRPAFYYSEEQRAALEQLLRHGDGAFRTRLQEDNTRDFLSAREVRRLRKTFQEYDADSDSEAAEHERSKGSSSADSGVHSTYWPQMSDTEAPPLDLGWPGSSGVYKGVTRVAVYSHPPKEPGPHIKEVVRRLIQEAHKAVAVVMDLLTDLLILQDLLEASSRRGVAVYVVLEARGVPYFLDMCSRLQVNAMHLRNLRVRTLKGAGLALSFGKLPGSLCSKYMLVDGEKVLFGSYSFTWSSSRMDRNTVTVMSGHVVDFFDNDFRELYAASEQVDLYREFNITKPPPPQTPVKKPAAEPLRPAPVSMSRFQASAGDPKKADLKVPAHKYHNPKYSLVFGNSMSRAGSLQDLSVMRESLDKRNGLYGSLLHVADPEKAASPPGAAAAPEDGGDDGKGSPKKNPAAPKKRSSFRHFLKGRGGNHHATETIEEGVVTPQSPPPPSPPRKPVENNNSSGATGSELDDSFEKAAAAAAAASKSKSKKPTKFIQRSVSLQAINTADDDGLKSRRRHHKKNCIQS